MTDAKPGYISDKQAYLNRLRRIEGRVRGLQRMVDDDTYCIGILTQVSAATKALQVPECRTQHPGSQLTTPWRGHR